MKCFSPTSLISFLYQTVKTESKGKDVTFSARLCQHYLWSFTMLLLTLILSSPVLRWKLKIQISTFIINFICCTINNKIWGRERKRQKGHSKSVFANVCSEVLVLSYAWDKTAPWPNKAWQLRAFSLSLTLRFMKHISTRKNLRCLDIQKFASVCLII